MHEGLTGVEYDPDEGTSLKQLKLQFLLFVGWKEELVELGGVFT